MSEISTNQPDIPINGATVSKGTLAGRKSQIFQQTGLATGSILLAAGGSSTLTFTLALFPLDLPDSLQSETTIIAREDSIAWPMEALYVDTPLDANYKLGASTLSSGQRKITLAKVNDIYPDFYSGSVRYSQQTNYLFFNNDASDHTIYFYGLYSYVMLGDSDL